MMARGYILLEAMLGGVLLGTVVLSMFGQVGDAQAESTRQARMLTAEQIVLTELEEVHALGFSSLPSTTSQVLLPTASQPFAVSGFANPGRYVRTRTVGSSVTETLVTSQNVNVSYKPVTVTVAFSDRSGSRSAVAVTRVYQ